MYSINQLKWKRPGRRCDVPTDDPSVVRTTLERYTYKVIVTMVMRTLDDPTSFAQSVVADLRPTSPFAYVAIGMSLFGSPLLPTDIIGLSLTISELFSWLQKHFHPTVRPSASPSDSDTMTNLYRFTSYRFVEGQNSKRDIMPGTAAK